MSKKKLRPEDSNLWSVGLRPDDMSAPALKPERLTNGKSSYRLDPAACQAWLAAHPDDGGKAREKIRAAMTSAENCINCVHYEADRGPGQFCRFLYKRIEHPEKLRCGKYERWVQKHPAPVPPAPRKLKTLFDQWRNS